MKIRIKKSFIKEATSPAGAITTALRMAKWQYKKGNFTFPFKFVGVYYIFFFDPDIPPLLMPNELRDWVDNWHNGFREPFTFTL